MTLFEAIKKLNRQYHTVTIALQAYIINKIIDDYK